MNITLSVDEQVAARAREAARLNMCLSDLKLFKSPPA